MIDTASPIEVLWFGIGLLTMAAALWNVAGAGTDWLWARTQDAALRQVAGTALQRGAGYLVLAFLNLYTGGVAIVLPPAPPPLVGEPVVVGLLRLSMIGALVLGAIVLTGLIALCGWERWAWRREQGGAPPAEGA